MKFQSPVQVRLLVLLAAARAALAVPVFAVPQGGQAVLERKQPPQQPEKQEKGREIACAGGSDVAPPHITVVIPRPAVTVDVGALADAIKGAAGPEDTWAEDTRGEDIRVWDDAEDTRGEDTRVWDDAEDTRGEETRAWDDAEDTRVWGDAEDTRVWDARSEDTRVWDNAEETRGLEEPLPMADDEDDDSDDEDDDSDDEEDQCTTADFLARHASAVPPRRDWLARDPEELVPAMHALNAFFAAATDSSALALGAPCVPQLHAGGALASANRACISRTTTAFCNPRTWAWERYRDCAAGGRRAECGVVRALNYDFDHAVWGLRVGCVQL